MKILSFIGFIFLTLIGTTEASVTTSEPKEIADGKRYIVQSTDHNSAHKDFISVIASCAEGDEIISGGCSGGIITKSKPNKSDGSRTFEYWVCGVELHNSPSATAYANCEKP